MREVVHAVGAGADPAGDVDAGVDVGGPHRAGQAVVAVVGDAHGVVVVVVGDDRRAPARRSPPGRCACRCRRRRTASARRTSPCRRRRAGRRRRRPGRPRRWPMRDVPLDPLPLALGDERADGGLHVGRVADRHAGDGLGEGLDDLVVARPRRQDAGLGDAGLAVVHDASAWAAGSATVASRSASSRMIAADLPPSSRVQRFSCSPQSAPIWRPAAVEPVNDDLVDAGVADEVLADLAAGGHDVDHARRAADLARAARPAAGVERRLRGRLEDDGGARRPARGRASAW